MENNFKYNKLRGRIIEKYGTQEKFAKAVNISPNALSRKMTGKIGLSQEDILEWSPLLDIEPSEYGSFYFE